MAVTCFNRPVRIGALLALVLLGLSTPLDGQETAADEQVPQQALAEDLVSRIGLQHGVCAVLGRDGDVSIDLARASKMLVHVCEPDAQQVQQLRERANKAGFGIQRLVVDRTGWDRLPYADNMIDALVVTHADQELLRSLSVQEVLRVLRPAGIAIIGKSKQSSGGDLDSEQLKQWSQAAAGPSQQADQFGTWAQLTKPPRAGADDWSHWEKSPDNNPVSNDTIIKAPYMTQFMAKPFYIGMPSVTTIAGGRTFLAIGHIAHHRREWEMLNKIIARNGYNGTVLWERPLPEGYLVHRSAFIASADTFYMIDGDRCLMLDAATGQDQGEIRIPGVRGAWKWMAMQDDILYVLAGEPDRGVTTTKGDRTFGGWSWADLSKEYYPRQIPVGFGDTLAAYDMKNEKRLWLHREQSLIDSRGLALRDNQVYLYCPDRHLRSLDQASGRILWTNDDERVFNLIEQPGKGLTSTPGWRTQSLVVATPEALIIQGQTRNNVVSISTVNGTMLWTKRKITNNPNAIFVDGDIILGVGKQGRMLVIDPVTGEEKEDLGFGKRACTRLTACEDSFFVRGEGLLRFDRESKEVLVDGSARPACNDGAMPANGLLYLGPWQCDCNLSLIGNIARCSAGDFRFNLTATADERLERADDYLQVEDLESSDRDWPTYRGNNQRSSSTAARLRGGLDPQWKFAPSRSSAPTPAVAVGRTIFSAGQDGKVRALDASSGQQDWEFATSGPITYPPTISSGRVYFGSADGYAYCLEASTGRMLWRFRAAPVERKIMVYDYLRSTWPVGSGVLVQDGVAYFAAGIVDHDGTYVYAVDAKTGEIKWQNNSSGHLSDRLRKGVSVQGNLSIFGKQLLLAGGNQVSPAQFDLETGQCLSQPYERPGVNGQPISNGGRFVGVFQDRSAIVGGRILYSAAENVSTKGSFNVFSGRNRYQLALGGIPPAWDDSVIALVNFKHGKLTCCDTKAMSQRIEQGYGDAPVTDQQQRRWQSLSDTLKSEAIHWQTDLNGANQFEVVSVAICPKSVVAVVKQQLRVRAWPTWTVVVLDKETGKVRGQRPLDSDPLPDGLLVDARGRIVVSMLNGDVVCFGNRS